MNSRAFVLTMLMALLTACAGPSTGGTVSGIQAPRQNCAACMEENPGDVRVCERICHEREGDTAGAWAGSVLR